MKNVIMLVCDGLTYHMVSDTKGHKAPMKFVKSLKEKSLWCTEAYSQAPYTEGAIKGLIYGMSPLERGGYYVEHIAYKDSIFKAFHDSGYDTFAHYYGSFVPPETLIDGVYSYADTVGNPMYGRYMKDKLSYYRPIWERGEFTEADYAFVRRLLDRQFECVFSLFSDEAKKNDVTGIFTPFETANAEFEKILNENLAKLKDEEKIYLQDKNKYIDGLFKNYDSCYFMNGTNWPAAPYSEAAHDQKKWINENYGYIFPKLKKANKKYYRRNRIPSWQNNKNHLKFLLHKESAAKGVEFFERQFQIATRMRMAYSKMLEPDQQQITTSAGCLMDQFMEWRKNTTSDKPYFTYMHFDEFHRPVSFISHESLDYDKLREEFEAADNYIDNLPADYNGDIDFDLSAQYFDIVIKRLFDFLEERNELDNTIVIVTADHGSSNCGETARFTTTNHFYKEQYHIPLVMYGVDKPEVYEDYVQSKDLPVTLAKLCGIEKGPDWNGVPVGEVKRQNVTVEYAGSGVCDLHRRAVLFSYRDKEKSFVVDGFITPEPKTADMHLTEYYDLCSDSEELKNIAGKISAEDAEKCKAFFAPRLKELYYNYEKYIEEIKSL